MNPEQFHDDVGSAAFDFAHRDGKSLTRFCFNMKVGENPDFWKARLLMPGAEFKGIIHAVFEMDDGAIRSLGDSKPFNALLFAGRSCFRIELMARSQAEFERMCEEIGALQSGPAPVSARRRVACALRWFWLRRPTVRFRGPLDIFNT